MQLYGGGGNVRMVLKKYGGRVWTGLIWLRLGTGG